MRWSLLGLQSIYRYLHWEYENQRAVPEDIPAVGRGIFNHFINPPKHFFRGWRLESSLSGCTLPAALWILFILLTQKTFKYCISVIAQVPGQPVHRTLWRRNAWHRVENLIALLFFCHLNIKISPQRNFKYVVSNTKVIISQHIKQKPRTD